MPSPSPNSRKIAPRNLPGSTRGDLPGPTRGLLQGTGHSISSSASRSLYERSDDHKENSTENGNVRGIQGRSLQNLRGASKKPWVTHFSKPAGTLSPSNRILVDRNSSSSPLRSGFPVRGQGEGLEDQKMMTTPPMEHEEAPASPGPVKGVAELSKRIQQFLEEQDVVLGIKSGSGQDLTSSCASISPAELGPRTLSSPYNPYKSPFFERPTFLRLNGSGSSMDEPAIVSKSTTDVVGLTMEQAVEELPLFEGDQVLATPLQPIQFSINLSPLSTEDDDVAHGEKYQEQLCESKLEEAFVDASKEANQPASECKEDYLLEPLKKSSQGIIIPYLLTETLDHAGAEHSVDQSQAGDMEIETSDVKEDEGVKTKVQSQSRDMPCVQPEGIEDGTGEAEYEFASQSLAGNTKLLQGQEDAAGAIELQSPTEDFERQQQSALDLMHQKEEALPEVSFKSQSCEELDDVGEEVCWGKRAGRLIFFGALLVAFVTLVLLSSAGPGLLPSSFINNPVHSFWHSSKYHERSMLFVRGMEGLWSTENIYLPADVQVTLKTGAEMLHSISRLSTEARLRLQIFAQVTSSISYDWWKIMLQHLSLLMNPNSDLGKEERGRQFEWLQEYEFEEEWQEEIPTLAYTDWELLHEYDLGAANQFVLGLIPEVLKDDLWRNFSQLTDSPRVKGLLKDLMKLKGGSTEEDRLEVLQYFWEYTRFSARAHETLMKSGYIGLDDASSHHQSCVDVSGVNPTGEQSTGVPADSEEQHQCHAEHGEEPDSLHLPGVEPPEEHSTDCPVISKEYQAEHTKLSEQYLNEAAEPPAGLFPQGGFQSEHADVVFEVTGQPEQQESHEISQSNTATIKEEWTEEIKSETADMLITNIQPAVNVKLDFVHLATLAAFLVASMFVLARSRLSKRAPKLTSPVSQNVQFLRKADQPPKSLDGDKDRRRPFTDAKQDQQQVTMIEELNDKFDSVLLQSPEPNWLPLQSPQTRKDEDVIRSPIPATTSSPYGSFTTYKLMSKKEGQAVETKLTPVRRSNRIRNHTGMSPQTNAVKRIAISPP